MNGLLVGLVVVVLVAFIGALVGVSWLVRRRIASRPPVQTVAELVRQRQEQAARAAADRAAAEPVEPAPEPAEPAREPVEADEPPPAAELLPVPAPAFLPLRRPGTVRIGTVPPWQRGAAMVGPAPAEEHEQAGPADPPARRPRPLPAEHAAVDLALLRTFGPEPTPRAAATGKPAPMPPTATATATATATVVATVPVRVRVRSRGGDPVEAEAGLLDQQGHEVARTSSDAEGRCELPAPRPGGYLLVASAPGHQPAALALTVEDGGAEVELPLVRSAAVLGTVRAADGPVPGAWVTLLQGGEVLDAVESCAAGRFRLVGLAAGRYGIAVAAAGFARVATTLRVPAESEVRHDVVLEPADG